jgi:hypothetical protein
MAVAKITIISNLLLSLGDASYVVPSGLITITYVLTRITGPPRLILPAATPLDRELAWAFNKAKSWAGVDEGFMGALSKASIYVEPLLRPTIFNLPVSMFKNAHILLINVVTPLLL